MTQKEARQRLRDFGMVLRKTDGGDFRVNFRNGAESSAYYTDNLKDAVDTGQNMAIRYVQQYGLTHAERKERGEIV